MLDCMEWLQIIEGNGGVHRHKQQLPVLLSLWFRLNNSNMPLAMPITIADTSTAIVTNQSWPNTRMAGLVAGSDVTYHRSSNACNMPKGY